MAREALADVAWHTDTCGSHLWLPLPGHWQADAFAAAAARADVLVTSAGAFLVPGHHAPAAVRLCLSHEALDGRVEWGLGILAGLLEAGCPEIHPV
ncbi:hypothetical protein [Gluconacetobacter tumulicola]|uniref:Uncharacterized protein n=1 Tax=Gluconacetobacter tumulicola TaxID=1017177 RepID=A0A7W4JE31_9PROT|nr:hypothetical protein [Gluconacetobacter tumulicola]MBB2179526.1 hypothetical protein [Gluconacetobacter tumulicola]